MAGNTFPMEGKPPPPMRVVLKCSLPQREGRASIVSQPLTAASRPRVSGCSLYNTCNASAGLKMFPIQCWGLGGGRLPQPSRRGWVKASFPRISFSFLKPFAHNPTVYKCLNNYYCQVHKQSPHTAVCGSADGKSVGLDYFLTWGEEGEDVY